MSIRICSTGFNQLRGDDENVRTVEVEAADFEAVPAVRVKASFKVVFDPIAQTLEVISSTGQPGLRFPFEPDERRSC